MSSAANSGTASAPTIGLYNSLNSVEITLDDHPRDGFDYSPIVELVRARWPEIDWVSTNCPPAGMKLANSHGVVGNYNFHIDEMTPALEPLVREIAEIIDGAGLMVPNLRFKISSTSAYAPMSAFTKAG